MSHVHAEAVKNIKNATVAKQEKIRFQRWQKRRYSKIEMWVHQIYIALDSHPKGKVDLNLSAYRMADQRISASLPNIHFKDIGKNKNGASPAEACKEIFEALYGTIIRPAVTDVLNKELSSMGVDLDALGQDEIKKLGETIGKEKGLDDIGNKVKGMFGN